MTDRVTYNFQDGVAQITMDDGKANIMSEAMLLELDIAFTRAENDQAIVVLKSARPNVFSAGFDTRVFASGDPAANLNMLKAGAELALRLLSFPHPVVGVVEGHAFPMGLFLLLACDVRIGVEGEYGLGLNEVAIGIVPPTFALELARGRLHPAWFSRTATTGQMFDPTEAVCAGMLDVVVSKAALDIAVQDTLAQLLRIDRSAHTATKLRARSPVISAVRSAIDAELTPEVFTKLAES